MYDWYELEVEPRHSGFSYMKRTRQYLLGYCKGRARLKLNPEDLYKHVVTHMEPQARTLPQDALLSCDMEVIRDCEDLARKYGSALYPNRLLGEQAPLNILNDEQRRYVDGYNQKWLHRVGLPPTGCPGLFYNLADNPIEGWTSWSAAGSLPTLRKNSNLLWSAWKSRRLTQNERLTCMGFPVYPILAQVGNLALVHFEP